MDSTMLLGKRNAEDGSEELDEYSEEILPDKRYKEEIDSGEDIKEEAELTEENGFRGFPMDFDYVKGEPEINDAEQLILSDGADLYESSYSFNDSVKCEPVKVENEDFMIVVPREDDSVDGDLLLDPSNIQDGVSRAKAANFRREYRPRGISYGGRVAPTRPVKPSCGATCHSQCSTRVSDEVRQELLENLLRLPLNNRWKFINDHICCMPVTYSRSLSSRRSMTNYYFLPVESRLVKVCKTMFLNTYDLADTMLRKIIAKKIGDKHVVCDNPNFPAVLQKGGGKFYFEYDEGCEQVAMSTQQQGGRCRCRMQCGSIFTEESIAQIRSNFRGMSVKEQTNFLSKLVQAPDDRERFKNTVIWARYFLPHESSAKEVCRKMFVNTFMLNTSMLANLLENLPKNPDLPRIDVVPYLENLNGGGIDDKILPDCDEAKDPLESEPAELNGAEREHNEFVEALPREDNSNDDRDQDYHSGTDSQAEVLSLDEKVEEPSIRRNLSQKKRKLHGLSYTTRSGLHCPARIVKPSCGAACHSQCGTRVSDEVRQRLLSNLLRKSLTDQKNFIADHICCMPVLNSRLLSSRRSLTYYYFLPVESRLVKVCKTMFMSTYDLSDQKIRLIVKRKSNKHVVCGNPNFPRLLKMGSKYDFDYDEGYDLPQEVCKCRMKCEVTFSKKVVRQIQRKFQEMSKQEQDTFLSKHVQMFNNKRNRHKTTLFQAHYFLPRGSTDLQKVCRRMFQHVFKLNKSQVCALVESVPISVDPLELAKEHIASHSMEEDHHCAVSGALLKLSRSPNVARMYSEYRAEGCRGWARTEGVEPIDYRQYFGEFCGHFAKTGLLLPTSCPDCGYFDRGEVG